MLISIPARVAGSTSTIPSTQRVNDQTDPTRADLQRRAVAMRAAGHPYRAIGAALGVSHTWAQNLVRAAVESAAGAWVQPLREQELSVVDGQLRALRRRRRVLVGGAV